MTRNDANAKLQPLSVDEIEDACFSGKDKAWVAVADLFDRKSEQKTITYKSLGDRIGKRRSQVHRWIDSSCNMTLQSLGLLAEGLDADLKIELCPRLNQSSARNNYCHPAEAAAAVVSLRLQASGQADTANEDIVGHLRQPMRTFHYHVEEA